MNGDELENSVVEGMKQKAMVQTWDDSGQRRAVNVNGIGRWGDDQGELKDLNKTTVKEILETGQRKD